MPRPIHPGRFLKLAGILLEIEVLKISRLNALKDSGNISDHIVSSIPRLLISIYSGIMPPPKNIVNIKMKLKTNGL